MITIHNRTPENHSSLTALEWLETNGKGGFASGTLSGIQTRKYHGLFIPALTPPINRTVLVSSIIEKIIVDGKEVEFSTNNFGGVVVPDSPSYLNFFEKQYVPHFVYEIEGVTFSKEILCIHEQDVVLLKYKILSKPKSIKSVHFSFSPLITNREIHNIEHNPQFKEIKCVHDTFEIDYPGIEKSLLISMKDCKVGGTPELFHNFFYETEHRRGYDAQENLWCCGQMLTQKWTEGDEQYLSISLGELSEESAKLWEEEITRRKENIPGSSSDIYTQLLLSAEQFIVKTNDEKYSIVAGYHWFTDWGRDTMIALNGLCLQTGKYDIAKKILTRFLKHTSDGIIPNKFNEDGTAMYNTVDATLWMFNAVYEYYVKTKDEEFIQQVFLPKALEIIQAHREGTHFNIKLQENGLLWAGEHGVQLTWMDAKVNDWVVTPRHGFAVEINALWYNALKITALFTKQAGQVDTTDELNQLALKNRLAFNFHFYNAKNKCLYDVIHDITHDESIRPNQIFAASLPFAVVDDEIAIQLLSAVNEHLYTPIGLKTLSNSHADYCPKYEGTVWQRDAAYHQGTVWLWLLNHFFQAADKYNYDVSELKKRSKEAIEKHLTSEGALGTLSEVFHADQPHDAGGCIAQAWSVSETINFYKNSK